VAKKPPRSRIARIASLGVMGGKVAGSYVGRRLKSAFEDEELRGRALERLHLDNAERIVDTMGRLKGAAMKVGQSVAIIADSLDLPEDVTAVLGKLHNHVEPMPFATIRRQLEEELGAPLDELFAELDPKPLGTASLAQAHVGRLPDGRECVVKVLHEGIDASVTSDLSALKAGLVGARILRRPKEEVDELFEEIRERLAEELDYLQEAANIAQFRRMFAGDERIRIPAVFPERSTERVLTMERLPGLRIEEFVASASPEARVRAGRTLGQMYYAQVFEHRTLHADPHPGNYLFEADGTVGLLDFGCVKRFDEHWVADYARTALAALDGDKQGCLEGARRCGVLLESRPQVDDALWRYCDLLIDPFRRGEYTAGGPDDDLLIPLARAFRPLMGMKEIRFERTLVFLHRALGGNYSLLKQLQARADWGAILRTYAGHAIAVSEGRARAGEGPVAPV
jgi:predicted unusual protein kinase regulating ubiquinone biosynthesis (AarF/ABC1/UbiB family)